MKVIINPGTEGVNTHCEKNAIASCRKFCEDAGFKDNSYTRDFRLDDAERGYYGFQVWNGKRRISVEIPGCETQVLTLSKPWVSPRMYVDGSSWLYSFALNVIQNDEE